MSGCSRVNRRGNMSHPGGWGQKNHVVEAKLGYRLRRDSAMLFDPTRYQPRLGTIFRWPQAQHPWLLFERGFVFSIYFVVQAYDWPAE